MTTTEAPAAVFDGCVEHKVSTKEVNDRWALPVVKGHPMLAMCRCCYGPALVDEFDHRGVGQGEMLCSRCKHVEA